MRNLRRFGFATIRALESLLDDNEQTDCSPTLEEQIAGIYKHLERLTNILQGLTSELATKKLVPRDFGNVLVLWQEAGAPRCISRTARLSAPSAFGSDRSLSQGATIDIDHMSIPAGAWVVAINCEITAVYIGPQTADLGPAPRGKLVVLREQLQTGVRLQIEVIAEK